MPDSHPSGQRIAYRGFRDTRASLEDLYAVYSDLYASATRITYVHALEDSHAFDYCKRRKFFVLALPYTTHKTLLMERAFTSTRFAWTLIGGSVRRDFEETFIDAAARHASKTIERLELGEIEPIAFLTNTFTYASQSCEHKGIAFVARIRNKDPQQSLDQQSHSRGHLVPIDDLSVSCDLPHNDQVLALARKYVSNVEFGTLPEFEIDENQKYQFRYAIHDRMTKPILRLFSKYFGEYSLSDFAKKILQEATKEPCAKILDIACGENSFVVDVARQTGIDVVVGNDVSWSQVELMTGRSSVDNMRNLKSLLLFTNHDGRHMPFSDKTFDFTICKCVLHHMENLDSVRQMIGEIIRVSKRALIIDVMDPKYEGRWGRLRHRYYLDFLHDAGRSFLSRLEFEEVTRHANRKNLYEMATIRAVYQFATYAHDV